LPLIVPATTASSCFLSTGIGSPEIIDSSMVLCPSVILPSTGIFFSWLYTAINLLYLYHE
jgi:hypothetical protein